MPHDLGTSGFILSVIALALMYPVGIFINLTSPAFQRFLARRSRAATVDRLRKVVHLHAAVKHEPMISEDIDNLLLGVQNVIGIITLGITGLLVSMMVLSYPLLIIYRVVVHKGIASLAGIPLFVLVVAAPILRATYLILGQMVDYRNRVSPLRRADMEQEMVELSAKLGIGGHANDGHQESN